MSSIFSSQPVIDKATLALYVKLSDVRNNHHWLELDKAKLRVEVQMCILSLQMKTLHSIDSNKNQVNQAGLYDGRVLKAWLLSEMSPQQYPETQ